MLVELVTRSRVKALTWRILGTVTTILLSYILIGELDVAFKIGPIDFVVKFITFFAHERLWQIPPLLKLHNRRFLKMMLWKVIALSLTISTSFFVTGKMEFALRLGPVDFFSKMFLYYFHEFVWDHISYGLVSLKQE